MVKPNTLAAVIHAYLASQKFRDLAPATQTTYRIYLRGAEDEGGIGGLPVAVLTVPLVQSFLDGLAMKPGAQARARVALRAVERWALRRGLMPFPITVGTETTKSEGGHKPWTDAQVAIAEHYAPPYIARIITLAANTGQRGSDLCRMTWADIEEIEGRPGINVTQQKTGLQIWVPMTQALMAAIQTWERRPTPFLLRYDGKPWSHRKEMSEAWLRERDRNEKLKPCAGMVLHGLRATAVIRLRRAGAPPTMISDMIGLSPRMIERYCRLADRKQSALAAVHYLDRMEPGTEHAQNKNDRKASGDH